MSKHRKRTPPAVGSVELLCEDCNTRVKCDAADVADALPACSECQQPMTPVAQHIVVRVGRKR